MLDTIATSEIVFSARYLNKEKAALRNLPDDIVDLYLRSIPEAYQEMNRRKDPDDLRLAACYWRHWIYSEEEATRFGRVADEKNRVGGLYALAIIDSIKVKNDFQPVEDLAAKYDFIYNPCWVHAGVAWNGDIENINAWRRLDANAILAFKGDYQGRPDSSPNGTMFWASVGVLWAPEYLVKKYQPDSKHDAFKRAIGEPMHLV